jgi:intracellular septation protein
VKNLLVAGRALAEDFASTILFLALYALTDNVTISVIAAIALAIAQMGWNFWRGQKPDALQWISLILVIGSGAATLAIHNPVFVMLKPSAIYLLVGAAMLQKGWMVRYVPPRAMEFVPDMVIGFGYVWAALMFFSALLNIILAVSCSVMAWGTIMAAWGTASKIALCLGQYGAMRFIGRRRHDHRAAIPPLASAAL